MNSALREVHRTGKTITSIPLANFSAGKRSQTNSYPVVSVAGNHSRSRPNKTEIHKFLLFI